MGRTCVAGLAAAALAVVCGCGGERSIAPADGGVPPLSERVARVSELRARFGVLRATLAAGATARVTVAADRPADFAVADIRSGMRARIVLLGTTPVAGEPVGDVLIHRAALAGSDVLSRAGADGAEDLVAFERAPALERVRYRLELEHGVAGLRLVAGSLELLDAEGTPRLRMRRPVLLDEHGVATPADVAVDGCAVSRDPRAPWHRPVTAPGGATCTLRVDWSGRGVRYPALLDPAWGTTGSMAVVRYNHTATLLGNGKVLVAGGSALTALSSAELYDPPTGSFAATGSMSGARNNHTATLLVDGRVLAVGGGLVSERMSAETYDATTGSWTLTGPLSGRHAGHTALRLADGRVLVAGDNTESKVEIFDPAGGANGTWSTVAPAATARNHPASALLYDGRAWLVGGEDGSQRFSSTEIYDPTADSWAAGPSLNFKHTRAATQTLADGRIVVFGSDTTADGPLGLAELATISSVQVSIVPTLAIDVGYWYPNLALLDDGTLLVADTAILDPTQGTWKTFTKASSGVTGSRWFTTTKLPDGTVLKVGGFDGNNAVAGAELYGPLANGQPCLNAGDCASGFCVDDVCCDTLCDGACMACSASTGSSTGPPGTCSPLQAAEFDSLCANAGNGFCGFDGQCTAQGTCRYKDAGSACGQQACKDATTAYAPDACDGAGACAAATATVACSPGSCQNGLCLQQCNGDGDCDASAYCDSPTNFHCTPDQPAGNPCTRDEMCVSGHCADGVCCDTTCTGSCQACDLPGTTGTCSPVPDGMDPHGECSDSGAGCDDDGYCDGQSACRKYAKKSDGSCDIGGCSADADCQSGHCIDGICCDGACDGQCESCHNQLTGAVEGRCAAVKYGTDPGGDCKNASGADQCKGPLVCSADRTCICSDSLPGCVGNTLVDGATGQETKCDPYICDSAAHQCRVQCSSSDDCVAGSICDVQQGDGVCTVVGAQGAADDGGCGCRVTGRSKPAGGALAWLSIAAFALARRKRRRQA